MKLPKSFNELTVRQFQEATQIIKDESDSLEREVKLIACLTGNSIEWVEKLKKSELVEYSKKVNALIIPNLEQRISKWLVVKGKLLRPNLNAESLTAGQLITLKTLEERA